MYTATGRSARQVHFDRQGYLDCWTETPLYASPPALPTREEVARKLIELCGINPDTLYEHHEWEDFPADETREYVDAITGEPRKTLMHRAWRKRLPDADAILALFPGDRR